MESEEPSIHFNCFVHYPGFTEDGLEEQTVARGNGIQLSPKTQLSSLAANVLSEMFQKQEIDGKVIMKADNAKGECVRFALLRFALLLVPVPVVEFSVKLALKYF